MKTQELNENQNKTLLDIHAAFELGNQPSMGDFNVRTLKALCRRGYISLADNTISLTDGSEVQAEYDNRDEDKESKLMRSELAETMSQYRHGYEDDRCGDKVSNILKSINPEDVLHVTERLVNLAPGTLDVRYSSLNNGQRRMNAGNLIRGAISRGEIIEDDIIQAVKMIK